MPLNPLPRLRLLLLEWFQSGTVHPWILVVYFLRPKKKCAPVSGVRRKSSRSLWIHDLLIVRDLPSDHPPGTGIVVIGDRGIIDLLINHGLLAIRDLGTHLIRA